MQQVKASEVSKCKAQEARTRARTRTARGGNCYCRRRCFAKRWLRDLRPLIGGVSAIGHAYDFQQLF